VLLYFHEGLGCQPCWDQISALEKANADLKTAGIDDLVAITTGPVDLVAQKVTDDTCHSEPRDTDLTVSRSYEANKYGMMGNDRDGHTFVLVGPDGKIRWRADYGGAPKYTMFVAGPAAAGRPQDRRPANDPGRPRETADSRRLRLLRPTPRTSSPVSASSSRWRSTRSGSIPPRAARSPSSTPSCSPRRTAERSLFSHGACPRRSCAARWSASRPPANGEQHRPTSQTP